MTTDTPLALADEDRILDAALGLFADVGVRRGRGQAGWRGPGDGLSPGGQQG
ncbi:hypothetical protein [Janibacter sp. G1551]|uniref:hypothetical protein n=1 Tax=Janibacter sp. G1551 TaxID=3420440 RepID=UPI003CFE3AF3